MLTARGTTFVRVALSTRGASVLQLGQSAPSDERCMGRDCSNNP
jgi:hypothetical protein